MANNEILSAVKEGATDVWCLQSLNNFKVGDIYSAEYFEEEGTVLVDNVVALDPDVFAEAFSLFPPATDVDELETENDGGIFASIPEGLSQQEIFTQLLRKTHRDGVEELLEWIESSDFFYSPASTKFHGSYDGGLLDHSLVVCSNALQLYGHYMRTFSATPHIPEESIIICSLLHDLCKVNTYETYMRNVKNDAGAWEQVQCYKRAPKFAMGHGGKSVFIIQQFMQISAQEAQAIFWHMGAYDTSPYNTWDEMSQAYNENMLAFLLHQADMMANYLQENTNYAGN